MMKPNETAETLSMTPFGNAFGLRPLPSLPDAPVPRPYNPFNPFNPVDRGGASFRSSFGPSFGPSLGPSLGSRAQVPTGSYSTTRFVMKRSLAEVGESNITKEIDALNVRAGRAN